MQWNVWGQLRSRLLTRLIDSSSPDQLQDLVAHVDRHHPRLIIGTRTYQRKQQLMQSAMTTLEGKAAAAEARAAKFDSTVEQIREQYRQLTLLDRSPRTGGTWSEDYDAIVQRKIDTARSHTKALEAELFSFAVGFVADMYPKVPFLWYDLRNARLHVTEAAAVLLSIDTNGIESTKVSPKALLRYVGEEYRPDIKAALKTGERLVRYKAQTSGEDPKDLRLTTHPLRYFDGNYNTIIGFGIFLYDNTKLPYRISFSGIARLSRSLEDAFERMKKRIYEIRPPEYQPSPALAYARL